MPLIELAQVGIMTILILVDYKMMLISLLRMLAANVEAASFTKIIIPSMKLKTLADLYMMVKKLLIFHNSLAFQCQQLLMIFARCITQQL